MLLAGACTRNEPSAVVPVTDDDLRAMVPRGADLPTGFAAGDDQALTNDEIASTSTDPDYTRELLDTWGRESGLRIAFSVDPKINRPLRPHRIDAAVERYRDAAGAATAWNAYSDLDDHRLPSYHSPARLETPSLGNQTSGIRMYFTDDAGRDLVVYRVRFRRESVITEVTTVALKHQDDKGRQAIRVARLMNERLQARLS